MLLARCKTVPVRRSISKLRIGGQPNEVPSADGRVASQFMQTRLRYSMRVIFAVFLIVAWAAVGAASIARAEGAREFGKAEFNKSCAQCHGVTGKGDGPLGMYLTKAPADLTKLSQQSGGVFPF